MTAVEWVESDDWRAVKSGDLVKFDKGAESCTTRAKDSTSAWILAPYGITYYKHDYWALSVVAAPVDLTPAGSHTASPHRGRGDLVSRRSTYQEPWRGDLARRTLWAVLIVLVAAAGFLLGLIVGRLS